MKNQYIIYTRTTGFRYLRVVAIVMALIHLPAHATILTVTNLNDSGSGSLRQAILNANAAADDDIIAFQSGLSGTIALTTGLLLIDSNLTNNGPSTSQPAISGNDFFSIFAINSGATAPVLRWDEPPSKVWNPY